MFIHIIYKQMLRRWCEQYNELPLTKLQRWRSAQGLARIDSDRAPYQTGSYNNQPAGYEVKTTRRRRRRRSWWLCNNRFQAASGSTVGVRRPREVQSTGQSQPSTLDSNMTVLFARREDLQQGNFSLLAGGETSNYRSDGLMHRRSLMTSIVLSLIHNNAIEQLIQKTA